MSIYNYVAVTTDGKRIKGEKKADTKEEVVKFLYDKNLTIVNVNEQLGAEINKIFSREIGGIPLKEKTILTRQLATMISAGIPILQAIDILAQQAERQGLREQLTNVYKNIESGSSLTEAFRKEKGIFTEIHLNLLAAGEKSANLSEMLEKITIDLETSRNLRGKITGAMIYPAVIFVVLIGVFVLMVTSLLPQVKELYKSLGQNELPPITEFLLSLGNSFSNPIVVVFVVVVVLGLFASYKYLNTTEEGKRRIDAIKLRIPIFGGIMQLYEVVQFSKLTAMLMSSGVQIIETLKIVSGASNNQVFKDIINNATEEVTKGSGLAMGLAKYNSKGAFPLILIKIVSTGEESGKLDQILEDMGKFYQSELEQITNNLTKLMEPLIMVIAGGMVGFLAIAVYLPIFQVGQFVQT